MAKVKQSFPLAVRYQDYVSAIGEGEVWSRQDFMEVMGKSYSTVRYHLDNAVKAGVLNCAVGDVSESKVGWLYALPTTMPRMEGM